MDIERVVDIGTIVEVGDVGGFLQRSRYGLGVPGRLHSCHG